MRQLFHSVIRGLVAATLIWSSQILGPSTKVVARAEQLMTLMTFQQFEHGFMLGGKDGVTVFPYDQPEPLADGAVRVAFEFSANDISVLKENAIANRPPERDYQPTGDFGKLWSNSLRIMRGLGWAITPPIQYTASVGAASGTYTSLPMGDWSVKTNGACIMEGLSCSVDFTLLNGTRVSAGQLIWTYVLMPGLEVTNRKCDTQRIQFQAGSYLAMVQGGLNATGCNEAVYLLRARARQRMTIIVLYQNRPAIGIVTAPDGTNIQKPFNEVIFDGILPATGDYSIYLTQDSSRPEPIFQDKYQGQQSQLSHYILLVVIR
jgi:hypothetical protein